MRYQETNNFYLLTYQKQDEHKQVSKLLIFYSLFILLSFIDNLLFVLPSERVAASLMHYQIIIILYQ